MGTTHLITEADQMDQLVEQADQMDQLMEQETEPDSTSSDEVLFKEAKTRMKSENYMEFIDKVKQWSREQQTVEEFLDSVYSTLGSDFPYIYQELRVKMLRREASKLRKSARNAAATGT